MGLVTVQSVLHRLQPAFQMRQGKYGSAAYRQGSIRGTSKRVRNTCRRMYYVKQKSNSLCRLTNLGAYRSKSVHGAAKPAHNIYMVHNTFITITLDSVDSTSLQYMMHIVSFLCGFIKCAAYRQSSIRGTLRHGDKICKVQSKCITTTYSYYIA